MWKWGVFRYEAFGVSEALWAVRRTRIFIGVSIAVPMWTSSCYTHVDMEKGYDVPQTSEVIIVGR